MKSQVLVTLTYNIVVEVEHSPFVQYSNGLVRDIYRTAADEAVAAAKKALGPAGPFEPEVETKVTSFRTPLFPPAPTPDPETESA